MSEQLAPETRNKSRERSKTPFHLRSQCDGDNCNEVGHIHGPTKKIPTVSTITEEPQSSASSHNSVSVTKTVVYSVTNNATSSQHNQNSIEASLSSTKPILTVPATTTTTKVNTKSNQSSSQKTVRKTMSGRTEVREHQDLSNLKHSTPKQNSVKVSQISPNILENLNLNDHLAYKEYKEAGEYWKKYPKTDYVYSPTYSPFRREIKPGIIAMPNMSRRSLESHQNRSNELASLTTTAQESYIRSRFQSNFDKFQNFNLSDDDLDANDYRTTSIYQSTEQKASIIRRFFTSIVTIIVTTFHKTCRIFSRSEVDYRNYRNGRYDGVNESADGTVTGLLSTTSSASRTMLASIFRYIYVTIASIQFWDSCVLQSSNTENRGKKRFLLLLLLLLLAAGLCASQTDKTTSLSDRLPLALQSFKNTGYDFVASTKSLLKSCFDFHWSLPILFQSYWTTTNNFPSSSSLSDRQYADLIKHIDAYIEHIIATKSKETISPEANNILIASIVKDTIVNYKYQLSLDDIERIANVVREKLREDESKLGVPLDEHREYIANVVKENVNLYAASAPTSQHHDELKVDDILAKVFGSATLSEAIHKQVVNQIDPQQRRIGTLESKIEFMTDKLSDKTLENQDLKHSLDMLKAEYAKLLGSVNVHNDDVDLKLIKLLNDVDAKFATFHQSQYATIDSHVQSILIDIMGYDSSSGKPTEVDLRAWIQNVFVAKTYLEQRLNELSATFDKNLKDELHRSAAILIKDVGDQIKKETLLVIENREKGHAGHVGTLDEMKIKGIVKEILAVYDADKTGLVDYALESAGGEVLSTRCTENYQAHYRLSVFGIPIPFTYQTNTPRTAISPTVQPGNCWSFQGFPGFLVLKLSTYVFVSGFTMEHIPKSLAPSGKIDSAPKNFSVWGLESESDRDPVEFGKYTFLENGTSLQYFAVQNTDVDRSFNVVELRVESNHGNQNYTCLYRFRVHGQPDT
ncbi:SUN domain-containing protein 2 isoform X2 [Bradysia coprophila]|uniref:SUN domain-containing protein 2 isoform X2 n=1 Tax=Bradysia coprophila TaxID=38358 RepID=UPI00187DBD78|nr:SUN domain-containing protein 2 isoform X2 [Bradysia coprophila]